MTKSVSSVAKELTVLDFSPGDGVVIHALSHQRNSKARSGSLTTLHGL